MRKNKIPPTAAEIRTNLENDLIQAKAVMYGALVFFLSGQAFVAYLVSGLLAIVLVMVIAFLWITRDMELVKVILHYEFPLVFPEPGW
jgi:hypothetical protein